MSIKNLMVKAVAISAVTAAASFAGVVEGYTWDATTAITCPNQISRPTNTPANQAGYHSNPSWQMLGTTWGANDGVSWSINGGEFGNKQTELNEGDEIQFKFDMYKPLWGTHTFDVIGVWIGDQKISTFSENADGTLVIDDKWKFNDGSKTNYIKENYYVTTKEIVEKYTDVNSVNGVKWENAARADGYYYGTKGNKTYRRIITGYEYGKPIYSYQRVTTEKKNVTTIDEEAYFSEYAANAHKFFYSDAITVTEDFGLTSRVVCSSDILSKANICNKNGMPTNVEQDGFHYPNAPTDDVISQIFGKDNNIGSQGEREVYSFTVKKNVPEPATLSLLGFSLLGLAFFRKKNSK